MSGRLDWFCNITAKFAGVSNKISKMVVVLERRKKRKETFLLEDLGACYMGYRIW